MEKDRKKELQNKVTSGFWGFWIKNYRLSYLMTILLIILGFVSIFTIPKEASPKVELGMVTVTAVYPGANPQDVDTLVTEKLYKAIEGIEGISSVKSTSSVGVSSLVVSAKTGVDTKDLRTEIHSKVSSVSLPTEVKEPNVTAIATSGNLAFSVYLYQKDNNASQDELIERAKVLHERLEKLPSVKSAAVSFDAVLTSSVGNAADDSKYDAEIIVKDETLRAHGLTLSNISQQISGLNRDIPIGNFRIDSKDYDFRISGKNIYTSDFLKTPISLPNGGTILLGDIATIERKYDSKKITNLVVDGKNYSAIGLVISKTDSASIFSVASEAKTEIETIFQEQGFKDFGFIYTSDIADQIITMYIDLFWNFVSTIGLVFVAMLVFVGLRDSVFAVIALPLAFLATFIMLDKLGYTMNSLTNFSLIISLGIAIDTVIIFVQASSAKLKLGYDPQTAIILAFKEYAVPVIVGTVTTVVVFIPIMSLPGIMGRFLAFIPVTIFGVLVFGLVLAVTINGALYRAMVKPRTTYVDNPEQLEYLDSDQKELLLLEREGKKEVQEKSLSFRARLISGMTAKYRALMDRLLPKKWYRRLAIALPVFFFFFGFNVIAPQINFELMPADDNDELSYTIKSTVGLTSEAMDAMVGDVAPYFANDPEIKNVSKVTNGNITTLTINLTPKKEREKNGQKSAFDLEKEMAKKFESLRSKGLHITGGVTAQGPPSSGAIGVNLETADNNNFQTLVSVAKDFEKYLDSLPETKDITNSSSETPGQFVFRLNKELLAQKGISPAMIYAAISEQTNGITVGSIKDGSHDIDVKLKNSAFTGAVTPDMIENISFSLGNTSYNIGNLLTVVPQNSVANIVRDGKNVQITVGADLVEGANSLQVNQQVLEFAKNYHYPAGIKYSAGGAQGENSELIVAMMTALFVSMMAIFATLTWQFNSYSRPAVVFYSVLMALPFVLLGLWITGNPFSLMFGIGFISLMGISVNHGILIIDATNQNLEKGMDGYLALTEATASRLEPMILTTLTTVLGMVPLTMEGAMWAGLAWTIIFGLLATTFIALFSLGALYYELFLKPKKPNIFKRMWRKIFRKNRSQNKSDTKNSQNDSKNIEPMAQNSLQVAENLQNEYNARMHQILEIA